MRYLADLVRVYPGVLAADTCAELIEGFEDRAGQQLIHANDGFRFAELNITREWQEAHDAAFAALLPWFEQYTRDLGIETLQWPAEIAFEELRIKRYQPGGDEFTDHVDVMDHSSARRFVAALLYLNDVDEGGETEFPLWGQRIIPRAGSLLLFPPLWPWLHAGRQPLSGPKHILSTYLHYV